MDLARAARMTIIASILLMLLLLPWLALLFVRPRPPDPD